MNKNILMLFVNQNQFATDLCCGVSRFTVEMSQFLMKKGHRVSIYNFVRNISVFNNMIYNAVQNGFTEIIQKENTFKAKYLGISYYMEVSPGVKPVETIISKIKNIKTDFIFTFEDSITALKAADFSDLPGIHSFNSLYAVKEISKSGKTGKKMLKSRRCVLACSKFVKKSIKKVLKTEAVVLNPVLFLEKYKVKQSDKAMSIGYCLTGGWKGEEVVKNMIARMKNTNFIIAGRSSPFVYGQKNVKYLGVVENMKSFYKNISILIVPSMCEEAFSRVILEAAVNAIPSIANKVGGVSESIGKSGILININSCNCENIADKYIKKIKILLTNNRLYAHYSKLAMLRSKEYICGKKNNTNVVYRKYIES